MLFFGHIGISSFIGKFLFLSPLIVGISALLPDVVDKGLLSLGLSQYTRLVAHNLFFGPVASAIVYTTTRRKEFALAFLFGTYIHLIQDAKEPLPLLWPLMNYSSILGTQIKITFDTFIIATESIGLSLLAILYLFNKNLIDVRTKFMMPFKDLYDKRFAKKV